MDLHSVLVELKSEILDLLVIKSFNIESFLIQQMSPEMFKNMKDQEKSLLALYESVFAIK